MLPPIVHFPLYTQKKNIDRVTEEMSLRFETGTSGTKTFCSDLLSSSFSAAACTISSCSISFLASSLSHIIPAILTTGGRDTKIHGMQDQFRERRSAKDATPWKSRTDGRRQPHLFWHQHIQILDSSCRRCLKENAAAKMGSKNTLQCVT